ncbi:hypothetical protein bthur0003_53600 [Bacillus thuringiensis serovar thuringiensis str. T01001]|uniref:Uncharacterized protein n=1 Tax=Bacillus thuringiensis TaxID=1428 RepID=Q49KJ4_BACTU|nr:unknown [Bacillus thuringiensis]AGG04601.1 hypothetical protein H175_68p77 [Bacillus thuringiensis serovar thuringiensis str. IS5056]EEM25641.1 hypothetical protein bthur0002_55210 [Bacillus thuringiensis Bt407]EEM32128.1 hypothetical protein bthur0003_53600 [Bacillus thuringiensis serovar thuringiensis str. T01001]EEM62548.1 hypothetical protein bthur0008_58680 [Bacillus thuringiensis serovar berliner ATCC 10792]
MNGHKQAKKIYYEDVLLKKGGVTNVEKYRKSLKMIAL